MNTDTVPYEHRVIADAIDSTMFVVQELKTGRGIVTSDRLADGAIAALNAAGFVISTTAFLNRQRAVIKALVEALARVIDNVETGSYESTGQAMHEARTALARAKELGDG